MSRGRRTAIHEYASPTLERQLLAALTMWPELLDMQGPTVEDLGLEPHRRLMRLVMSRHDQRLNVDPASLIEAEVPDGDVPWVADLWTHLPPTRYAVSSILVDLRRYRHRRIVRDVTAEIRQAVTDGEGSDQLMTRMQAGAGLLAMVGTDTVEAADRVAMRVMDDIDAEMSGERRLYYRSGIPEWDEHPEFGGVSSEGITLVIAASGMGKTSLLNRLAIGMAASGTPVYLHGTETSRKRRMRDLACSLVGLSSRQWTRAIEAGDTRWLSPRAHQMRGALSWLSSLPLTIGGAGRTVEQVCGMARTLHRDRRCSALICDYLQDFTRSQGTDGARTAQVDHASATLKELAAELGIPVVVGAQVSGEKGGVAMGPNAPAPVPQMYDVQWSSKAHQDSEEVYALYRDDYYQQVVDGWTSKGPPGTLEVYARKRRDGKKARLSLPFTVPGKWVGEPIGWGEP